MLEYALALAAVILLWRLSGDNDARSALIAISLTFAAWSGFIGITIWLKHKGIIPHAQYEPWYWGIVIDSLAANHLLRQPYSRKKATIAAIFCVQVVMHAAYGARMLLDGKADWEGYYQQTSITGWMQLLLLGGWSGGIAWRLYNPLRRLVPASSAPAHHRDLDGRA